MITSVNSFNPSGVIKDPRRKSQSVQFKERAVVPYKDAYTQQHSNQKSNALLTSSSIVAGSVLFTIGYFLLSAMSMSAKKAI